MLAFLRLKGEEAGIAAARVSHGVLKGRRGATCHVVVERQHKNSAATPGKKGPHANPVNSSNKNEHPVLAASSDLPDEVLTKPEENAAILPAFSVRDARRHKVIKRRPARLSGA